MIVHTYCNSPYSLIDFVSVQYCHDVLLHDACFVLVRSHDLFIHLCFSLFSRFSFSEYAGDVRIVKNINTEANSNSILLLDHSHRHQGGMVLATEV